MHRNGPIKMGICKGEKVTSNKLKRILFSIVIWLFVLLWVHGVKKFSSSTVNV